MNVSSLARTMYIGMKKTYSGFNVFLRRDRIKFKYNETSFITTSIGQLSYFKWLLDNDILDYIQNNIIEIKNLMGRGCPPRPLPVDPHLAKVICGSTSQGEGVVGEIADIIEEVEVGMLSQGNKILDAVHALLDSSGGLETGLGHNMGDNASSLS